METPANTNPRHAPAWIEPARRVVALLLIVPLLITGVFGGSSILAHRHHGHTSHWHVAPSPSGALLAAARHKAYHESHDSSRAQRHRHSHPHSHDKTTPVHTHGHQDGDHPGHEFPSRDDGFPADQPIDGLLITVPDHEQTLTRGGADVVATAMEHSAAVVLFILVPTRGIAHDDIEPGGPPDATPRHLLALSAGDRLLRTSRALRI